MFRLVGLFFAHLVIPIVNADEMIPAFPTAEGAGKFAVGGRGGTVIPVTNLNAAGPGSLRAAVEAKGPRTIVFRVGGVIDLQKQPLWIKEPYCTIAGQTAPGDGICLKNGELLAAHTHDIIIRHLRMRGGAIESQPGGNSWGGIEVAGSQKVIIDHCSISWGQDDMTGVTGDEGHHADQVTYQWCIVTEGLGHQETKNPKDFDPGKVALIDYLRESDTVSLLHNLWAHSTYRFPVIGAGRVQMVNNVIYNSQSNATYLIPVRSRIHLEAVKNYYLVGPVGCMR